MMELMIPSAPTGRQGDNLRKVVSGQLPVKRKNMNYSVFSVLSVALLHPEPATSQRVR